MKYRVLVINFGSTSTKVSVFEDDEQVMKQSIDHLPDELAKFKELWDQFDYRKNAILATLAENGYDMKDFDAVASRGGNSKPIPGGIYLINQAKMVGDRDASK